MPLLSICWKAEKALSLYSLAVWVGSGACKGGELELYSGKDAGTMDGHTQWQQLALHTWYIPLPTMIISVLFSNTA